MAKKTQSVKKKVVKVGSNDISFVHSTFNNVIITITNEFCKVII
jgi:small subunit ribosomal protein S11